MLRFLKSWWLRLPTTTQLVIATIAWAVLSCAFIVWWATWAQF